MSENMQPAGSSKREENNVNNKLQATELKESRYATTTDHNNVDDNIMINNNNYYIKDSRYDGGRRDSTDSAQVVTKHNAMTATDFEDVV